MPPSLVELLDPLKRGRRKDQVLAVLFFLHQYEGQEEATTTQVREGLRRGRVPKSKAINVSDVLAKAAPLVDKTGRSTWLLTSSGEEHIRDVLVIPDESPQVQHDVAKLETLVASVSDANVRDYIEEGIKCLKVGAMRAAVVFIWTGGVEAIRGEVWAYGTKSIDAAIKKHDKKARDFIKRDDFENVKDSALLQIAHDFGIHDKSEKKRLKEALDLRNDCGHPVKYKPGKHKVASYIEDVITVVFTSS